jgi:hypothetical protein
VIPARVGSLEVPVGRKGGSYSFEKRRKELEKKKKKQEKRERLRARKVDMEEDDPQQLEDAPEDDTSEESGV